MHGILEREILSRSIEVNDSDGAFGRCTKVDDLVVNTFSEHRKAPRFRDTFTIVQLKLTTRNFGTCKCSEVLEGHGDVLQSQIRKGVSSNLSTGDASMTAISSVLILVSIYFSRSLRSLTHRPFRNGLNFPLRYLHFDLSLPNVSLPPHTNHVAIRTHYDSFLPEVAQSRNFQVCPNFQGLYS